MIKYLQKLNRELFETAKEKAERENLSRKELLEGKTLREVYDKYGAL